MGYSRLIMERNSTTIMLPYSNQNIRRLALVSFIVLVGGFLLIEPLVTLDPKTGTTAFFQRKIRDIAPSTCPTDSHVLFNGYSALGFPLYVDFNNSYPRFRENDCLGWGDDDVSTENSVSINVRSEHPRLFAPSYKWHRLPFLIQQDPYLKLWNDSIIQQAEMYYDMPPIEYFIDGSLSSGGVLDTSRKLQLRVKHWAYAYQLFNDTKWIDRTWKELVVACGNSSQSFGVAGDNWNTQWRTLIPVLLFKLICDGRHWLDVGEFTTAYAIAYDWLYDAWTADQRDSIMWSIISLGLQKGHEAYDNDEWFLSVNGNWNCITNSGMVTGSLAIYHEDPTGTAARLLALAIPNVQQNCAQAVYSDGTWSETTNYWYFGVQGHAQIASALLTATGSTQGLLKVNNALNNTSLFHMYSLGMADLFNYGDCGPEKLTATANAMLFYGDQFKIPMYALYQRDFAEAADPLSMFWYNPQVAGTWYTGLPLDYNFPNPQSPWVSMRSSWTDTTGLFVAIKAGPAIGHQTHGNIDAGDFVFDALGERWAGELGHQSYLSTGYFSSEKQNSTRWLYYRTRTEGQNTITYNGSNQIVDAKPPSVRFETTGDVQTNQTGQHNLNSAVYWIANLTDSYNGTSIERGFRLFHGRSQLLIQDEITKATETSQWRMHTNATITYGEGNRIANLALHGKTVTATLQSPLGATFQTLTPTRMPTSPPLPEGETDAENEGVAVLAVDIPAGTHTVAVVFSPLWSDASETVVPPLVPLEDWTLDSHLVSEI